MFGTTLHELKLFDHAGPLARHAQRLAAGQPPILYRCASKPGMTTARIPEHRAGLCEEEVAPPS